MFPIAIIAFAGYFGFQYYQAFQAFYEKYKWSVTDVSIDSAKTAQSNFLKFFYKVNFKLSNPTTFLVKITACRFGVFYKGLKIADIAKTKPFDINANKAALLDAEVVIDTQHLGALVIPLINEIKQGGKIEYNLKGTITCFWLFQIPIDYNFNVL